MCRFFLQHFHAFPSISFNYTVFVCFLVVWSDSFLHTKIPHRNSIQENVSGLKSNHEYIGFTLPNQLKDEVIGWFALQPGGYKFHRTIWLVGLIRCFFLAWRAYLEGVPQLNKHPINPTILIHFAGEVPRSWIWISIGAAVCWVFQPLAFLLWKAKELPTCWRHQPKTSSPTTFSTALSRSYNRKNTTET